MTRLGAVFWGGLVLASGFVTFNVKYAVQGIEDELARVRRQAIAEQQEIRVLAAEWAYLNHPDRLAELNRNFLQLAPMTAKQLQGRVEEIALRAPPAGVPDTMIAANPPIATPAAANPPVVTLASAVSSLPPLAPPARATRAGGPSVAEVQMAEAPAGGARAAHAQGREINGAETQRVDASAGGVRAADTLAEGAAALAEALHLLGVDVGGQTPRVRLAKAAPASLDALVSKIADTR
jgi:hypothetical protein